MTLVPDIIQEAYREGNLIAMNTSPSTPQSEEGLKILNRVVSGAYGYEVGDAFFDWPVGTLDMVQPNDGWTEVRWRGLLAQARIVCLQESAQTLYLPPDPEDGARIAFLDPRDLCATYPITLDGNGRLIAGSASVLIEDNAARVWMYRGDLGYWVVVTSLSGASDEEFPFPAEFDDYFITKTAMRLNPRYGRSMSEESVAALDMTLAKLRSRYEQTQLYPCELGAVALTQGYGDFLGRSPRLGINFKTLSRGDRIGWMQ